MNISALILSYNLLVSRLITTAAVKLNNNISDIDKKTNIFKAIYYKKHGILFIDESVLAEKSKGIILKIRDMEDIDEPFIIVTSTNNNISRIIQDIGGDAFLPIPFSKMIFQSLFRGLLNQPRIILLASNPKSDVTGFGEKLTSKG